MRFAKGHGTGNDFVVLPDPDDRLELSAALVRALCDRRTGLGADGVLRVVPASSGPTGLAGPARWFMDHWNADGSLPEMCGNGVRVFARYLLDHGLAAGPELAIGTRAGIKAVRVEPDGRYSVAMGPAVITGKATAVIGGRAFPGLGVDVGNPHLACVVTEPAAGFDLSVPPVVDAAEFPDGVNVEIVRVIGDRVAEMRVHERGSGETLSCGTGAVAAAVAAAESVAAELIAGAGLGGDAGAGGWEIRVPGGVLAVTPSATASILTGPAVIVAEGDWLTG